MKKNSELGGSPQRNYHLKVLLIMKITTLFLFAFAMQISANVFSQRTRLQVDFKQATIREVISVIEKKTDFTFLYSNDLLNTGQTISISTKNASLDEILSEIRNQTGLNIEVVDKQILIKKGDLPARAPVKTQQNKPVKGKVTNPQGEPMPGVTVLVKGTTNGTTTSVDGEYSLNVTGQNAVLQFSFIGMKTQEVEVKGRAVINVILEEESIGIEEVVAVGYGAQKKVSIIGSVTTIEPKKLITSNANLSSSFAGQLSGVLAVQRSGEPGRDQSDFWIRGVSTFNANSQKAMVLVDGVERDMNNVDPLDIESFSILKDATATAVYGVRGANGVILINTKKGKTGEPKIQVQLEKSMNAPVQLPKYIDGVRYMEIYNEACRNSGVAEKFSQARIDKTRSGEDPDLYPNVDWMNEVFQDFSTNEKVNLNVSGGTEKIRYYVSGAYLHENGILKTDEMEDKKSRLKFDRFNFRSNIDIDISKTTLFKLNLGGYYKEKGQPGYGVSDIFMSTLAATPIGYPKIYSDGSYAHLGGSQINPWMASTHSGYSMNTENQIESTIALEQKLDFITKGLSAKGLFSFDAYNNQLTVLKKNPTTYYATGRDSEGTLILKPEEGTDYVSLTDETNTSTRGTYIEAQINYQKTIADVHNLSALLLYNQSGSKYTPAYSEVGSLPYRTNGLAGRLTYNYADRYFAEGNFGYNGSENFAPGKKYGFFPSVAVGWLVSQEGFYSKNLAKYINKLKLKASYGLVGNDQISASRRFGYLTILTTGLNGYSWGSDGKYTWGGIGVSEYGDSQMTWEKAKKTNFGLEAGFLNMIDLSIDYYQEYRSDIYMRMNSVPASTGISNLPYGNLGEMSNRGVDLSLIVNKKINKDMFLSVNGSFTYARNKIEKMDEPESKYAYQNKTGKRYGQLFGLLADRLYTTDDFNADGTLKADLPVPSYMNQVFPGDIKYIDYNNDKVVNDYDKVAIGYAENPEIVYGLGASIQYKNFDLGFLFQGVAHTSLMLGDDASGISSFFFPAQSSGTQGNILSNIDDRWTVDNPRQDVFWPRLSTNGINKNNNQPSTWWLRNASFCRLKNLEVGYKIDALKSKISLLRVYLRGTNLLTWSKDFKNLWDPELASPNGMKYPSNKVVTLGLEVNF